MTPVTIISIDGPPQRLCALALKSLHHPNPTRKGKVRNTMESTPNSKTNTFWFKNSFRLLLPLISVSRHNKTDVHAQLYYYTE